MSDYNSPNPAIMDAGRQLGAGLGSFINNVKEHVEKKKRENDTGDAIGKIFKANPELMSMTGMDDNEFKGLSSRQKIATFSTLAQTMALQGQMQQQKAEASKVGYYGEKMAGERLQNQSAQLDEETYRRFQQMNQQPDDVQSPMAPPDDATRMIQNGMKAGMRPRQMEELATMAERIHKSQAEAKGPPKPQVYDIKGKSFVGYGGNGLIPLDDKAGGGPKFHEDDDGNKYLWTGSAWQHIPRQSKGGLIQDTDENGNPVEGSYTDKTTGKKVKTPVGDPAKKALANVISGGNDATATTGKAKKVFNLKTGKFE